MFYVHINSMNSYSMSHKVWIILWKMPKSMVNVSVHLLLDLYTGLKWYFGTFFCSICQSCILILDGFWCLPICRNIYIPYYLICIHAFSLMILSLSIPWIQWYFWLEKDSKTTRKWFEKWLETLQLFSQLDNDRHTY